MRLGAPDDRVAGYYSSFLVFAGITALWAMILREDTFYAMRELLGVSLPAATLGYLVTMPLVGFGVGRWRYQASDGGGPASFLGKAIARIFNFVYSHLLISLFTIAMVVEAYFGFSLDSLIEAIDNNIFDLASRFAPWLSSYLAGFNLGQKADHQG